MRQIILTIQDAKIGRPVLSQVSIFTTASEGVEEMARRFQIDVDKLIGGIIVACAIVEHIALDGSLRTEANTGADVEEGAQFIWLTENGYRPEFRIPTFKESLMVSGTATVDITDTDVNTFVTNIILGYFNDGIETARQDITDKYGDDIEALENAIESFVRTRS